MVNVFGVFKAREIRKKDCLDRGMSMTENEAKKGLLFLKEKLYNGIFKDKLGCIDKAIQALEENQQYRAIGLTPTMVKDLIKSCKKHEKNALENAHIVDEYRAIGTVEEFKDLKEQNIELHCEFQSINATMDLFEQEIRAKAIDEFLRKICEKYTEEESKGNYKQFCVNIKQEIADIAEQMKAGGKNE